MLALGGVMFAAELASAQPPVTIGDPSYDGSGCPPGTATVSLSADRQELRIIFREYDVSTSPFRGTAFRNCALTVPIEIPPGWQASIFQITARGSYFAPPGGRARYQAQYAYVGGPTVWVTEDLPPVDFVEGFEIPESLAVEWTPCGDDTLLSADTTISVQRPSESTDQAEISLTSANVAITCSIRYRRCGPY